MNETSQPRSAPGRIIQMLAIVGGAVALDQVIKWLVETRLPFHELVPVIPMLALFRTWNEGIAFSLLSEMPDTWLLALTAVVIVFVSYLWWRNPPGRPIAHFGYALIISGALGNLIDRAVYGHVVDYILFHTETWSFAVFNLADSFISIGAALIVLDELIHALRDRKSRD